nr:heparinase II/III-family protein [Acanthopleuribacter pedis]
MFPSGKPWADLFFDDAKCREVEVPDYWWRPLIEEAGGLHRGVIRYFAYHNQRVGSPPNWFLNPFNQKSVGKPNLHWTGLKDFDAALGDIKIVWEASRFRWAPLLARAYRMTGEHQHLELLNAWIADWTEKNPTNRGPNWKCGQESGLRLLHIMLTAHLLDNFHRPNTALMRFTADHCARIDRNIRYAVAQDNNHGTSEAAALMVGGLWLNRYAGEEAQRRAGEVWAEKGRARLEERILYLIEDDGGFSQFSCTYHRLMQDTLHLAEWMRRALKAPPFSDRFLAKMRAATDWLYQVTDPTTGDAPNLGWNDGSYEFILSAAGYRDFRPTVQLGAALFHGKRYYDDPRLDEPLFWLNLAAAPNGTAEAGDTQAAPAPLPLAPPPRVSRRYAQSGFVVLHGPKSWALLRTPTTKFRPPHADALHLDLWHGTNNLLRDSGSYSYNDDPKVFLHLTGTEGHNTVTFDQRDQMPRLSRFMFGPWVEVHEDQALRENEHGVSWSGWYRDLWGCRHHREVRAEGSQWIIRDEVSGFRDEACLRWRLTPDVWQLRDNHVEQAEVTIQVAVAEGGEATYTLEEGWESRYYWQVGKLPVFCIRVKQPATLITTLAFRE